jgi:hypothetical protein
MGYLWLIFTVFFLGAGFTTLLNPSNPVPPGLVPGSGILSVSLLILMYYSIRKYDYKSDLKNPVHLIQGEFETTKGEGYDYGVEHNWFYNKTTATECNEILKTLQDGDAVSIEFSPRSNFVWKIEKMS